MPIPIVWSDINQRFSPDSQGRIKLDKNMAAVYTSIDNILGTFQGERVMLPEFASRLKSIVFEPLNESLMSFYSKEIKTVIETWDNRVSIVGLDFNADHDRNFIGISVTFRIRGYNEVFQYEKNF